MRYSESEIRPQFRKHCGERKYCLSFRNRVMVKNVETGEVFNSMRAAEQEYGVSYGSISQVLNSHKRTAGCHWVTCTSDDFEDFNE